MGQWRRQRDRGRPRRFPQVCCQVLPFIFAILLTLWEVASVVLHSYFIELYHEYFDSDLIALAAPVFHIIGLIIAFGMLVAMFLVILTVTQDCGGLLIPVNIMFLLRFALALTLIGFQVFGRNEMKPFHLKIEDGNDSLSTTTSSNSSSTPTTSVTLSSKTTTSVARITTTTTTEWDRPLKSRLDGDTNSSDSSNGSLFVFVEPLDDLNPWDQGLVILVADAILHGLFLVFFLAIGIWYESPYEKRSRGRISTLIRNRNSSMHWDVPVAREKSTVVKHIRSSSDGAPQTMVIVQATRSKTGTKADLRGSRSNTRRPRSRSDNPSSKSRSRYSSSSHRRHDRRGHSRRSNDSDDEQESGRHRRKERSRRRDSSHSSDGKHSGDLEVHRSRSQSSSKRTRRGGHEEKKDSEIPEPQEMQTRNLYKIVSNPADADVEIVDVSESQSSSSRPRKGLVRRLISVFRRI